MLKFEETIENKSFSTTRVDPKTVFEPYPSQKNSPFVPQKVKKTHNLSQNKKSELKEL